MCNRVFSYLTHRLLCFCAAIEAIANFIPAPEEVAALKGSLPSVLPPVEQFLREIVMVRASISFSALSSTHLRASGPLIPPQMQKLFCSTSCKQLASCG
jgi:hypothetical protein